MRSWQAGVPWAVVMVGVVGAAVFGWFAWQDWEKLQVAYRKFEAVASGPADLNALFVAEAKQNIHRLNLFAQGVWTLLCVVIACIGWHGLYVTRKD